MRRFGLWFDTPAVKIVVPSKKDQPQCKKGPNVFQIRLRVAYSGIRRKVNLNPFLTMSAVMPDTCLLHLEISRNAGRRRSYFFRNSFFPFRFDHALTR